MHGFDLLVVDAGFAPASSTPCAFRESTRSRSSCSRPTRGRVRRWRAAQILPERSHRPCPAGMPSRDGRGGEPDPFAAQSASAPTSPSFRPGPVADRRPERRIVSKCRDLRSQHARLHVRRRRSLLSVASNVAAVDRCPPQARDCRCRRQAVEQLQARADGIS